MPHTDVPLHAADISAFAKLLARELKQTHEQAMALMRALRERRSAA